MTTMTDKLLRVQSRTVKVLGPVLQGSFTPPLLVHLCTYSLPSFSDHDPITREGLRDCRQESVPTKTGL